MTQDAQTPNLEPELITIPAGPFLMGTGDEQIRDLRSRFDWAVNFQFWNEQPQHSIHLPAFQIGRHPITNAQYAAFVRDTGHAAPSHWPDGRLPDDLVGHPVVHVSWYDAQDYLAWLGELTGRPFRLPAEAEWEKAARGTDARLWPWGNDWDPTLYQSQVNRPFVTNPAGHYSPASDSPYGCADMVGHTVEWSRSSQRAYPYEPGHDPMDNGLSRFMIVRGGSFSYDQGYVRCALRRKYFPWRGNMYIGFRVCITDHQE